MGEPGSLAALRKWTPVRAWSLGGEQTGGLRAKGWPWVLGGDWEGASRDVGPRGGALSGDGCRQQGLTSQVRVLGLGHCEGGASRPAGAGS